MKEPPTVVSGPMKPREDQEEGFHRLLLWIDGVGGFLVCLGNRITLGHAGLDAAVDVPILADVSRHHATVQRDPEGYFLEAVRQVQVNSQRVDKAFLHSGDRITLGNSCQFIFTQAVPVSASARLDLTSGHRLWHALDGVLMMAETLILGPGPQVHILVPDLNQPLILFRQKNGLAARYSGNLWVNNQPCQERCMLEPGARLATEDVVLTLEKISKR
jgi:hypothetical protein